MNKKTLLFGLVAGLISSVWLILIPFLDQSEFNYSLGMVYGYAAMLAAFIFIFIGIKHQRDKQNGGTITFKQSFLTGATIAFIASSIYVITWLIDYYFFVPDFFDTLCKSMEHMGKSAQEIETAKTELAHYKELYKNPVYNAAFTYLEILPLGLVISVIASFILKRTK